MNILALDLISYTEHKYTYTDIGVCYASWAVENKLKNEVKIHNCPHKMAIKPKILRLQQTSLAKQDQLIFILYSKIGVKSMYLGE